MRSSWFIQVGPQCTKCPYERHTEERHTGRRGEGHMMTEAEIEVMYPQAKEHLEPPEAVGGKARFSARVWRRSMALRAHLNYRPWPPELGEYPFLCFKP